MFPRRPARLATFDYLGFHRYFLTFCTHRRSTLFTAHDAVDTVMSQIVRAATDEQFAVVAYCFMPDHLHLLVEGEAEQADGRAFIARAKQYSGFHYRKAFGTRLWQTHGFERTLRSDDDMLSVARYIVENPLRAGLVQRVSEYPFVGSMRYSMVEILEAIQLQDGRRWRSGASR